MIDRILKLCLQTPILVLIMTALVVVFGFQSLQDNPKDAIPDISENQVIVSTMWMGATPQDMEDQVTYPLAQQLQGIPKIVDVRTMSGFGMSRIYVVFEDGVDVYWARSRVLERLAVAAGTLPEGVKPALGPDASSLGQVYQYTVEGPYDLAELRTIQDYTVKYALQNAKGVAEVASVGGHVREYQIDVDPDVLRAHGLTLKHLAMALKMSNQDVGAKTLEQGGLEYLIRGVGFIKSLEDIEQIVVKNDGHIPVTIGDVATIQYGAEFRRGALADDKGEVVGGIVTMRYGANPQSVINNIKEEIEKLEPALPKGVVIKPFYDRSQLIDETLETLTNTILAEILITVFVVVLFLLHLRSGLIISSTIPLSVLLAFIGMEAFGVGSNIMSLGGIIIAIGTVVDMGIIMTETIYRALVDDGGKSKRFDVVYAASREVGGAVFTAVLTTVISFAPIFFLTGQSYKLFSPLAWTKTFMLLSAAILAITLIPVLCYLFLGGRKKVASPRVVLARKIFGWASSLAFGSLLAWVALRFNGWFEANTGIQIWFVAAALFVLGTLVVHRMWDEKLTPMDDSPVSKAIVKTYRPALGFCLQNKWILACVYFGFLLWGAVAMLGARTVLFPFYDDEPTKALPLAMLDEHYPGFGSEFMPPLDEGSLLFMPSTLSQAGMGETLKVMEWENEQIAKVPEVTQVVGKLGRAETSLDPAPIGMIETIVNLKPKKDWRKEVPQELLVVRLRRQWHESDLRREMREGSTKEAIINALDDGLSMNELADQVEAADDADALRELKESGETLTLGEQLIINLSRDLTQKTLIADLRQVTRQPGVAPSWLQPIETRIIMLSSGIKARIGLELVGNNAADLAELALKLEPIIKEVDGTSDVTALRIGGKPYIEFHLNRERMKHYDVNVEDVNNIIKIAQGGMKVTTTVEGRERYPVRIRYERDRRDSIEKLGDLLITTGTGAQIPITEVADIKHVLGPAAIRGINGQLVGYVMFNAVDVDEVTLIDRVEARVQKAKRDGEIDWPKGYSYRWVGQYQEAIKASERLSYIIPIALALILLLVFLHFKRLSTTLFVFSGVPLGLAGGVLMIRYWPWMQSMFTGLPQGAPIYMTVAVVVGFIALLGIIVDDGVVIGTYIDQIYDKKKPTTREEIRAVVTEAGARRIRPTLMSTATTIIALVPVLWSTGRGSDVLQPMALPVVGGMFMDLLTLFVVPTAMCYWLELKHRKKRE